MGAQVECLNRRAAGAAPAAEDEQAVADHGACPVVERLRDGAEIDEAAVARVEPEDAVRRLSGSIQASGDQDPAAGCDGDFALHRRRQVKRRRANHDSVT